MSASLVGSEMCIRDSLCVRQRGDCSRTRARIATALACAAPRMLADLRARHTKQQFAMVLKCEERWARR
eukprot:15435154-Alexandrium_andersonii.AAC.1